MWPFSSRKPRSTHSAQGRRNSFRPCLEVLEDRCLLSAGVLDPTFGNGAGYVTTSLSSGDDQAYSALVQPDGKIIATGIAYDRSVPPAFPTDTTSQAGLVRYNADGSLDTSFGNGGEVLGPANPNTDYTGRRPTAALYPTTGTANDGKIVLANFSLNFSLARYNPDGTLDTSFGNNGIATANFGSTLGSWGDASVVIQPDGKIVAVGTSSNNETLEMARFNADGSLDTTFGQNGLVTTPLLSGEQANVYQTLLLQPNGGLIVTTAATGGSSRLSHWDLIGYNADGSLNTSFGTGGFVRTPPTGNGDFTSGDGAAALYPTEGTVNDGKILMAGRGTSPNGSAEPLVRRYNANGTLDSTFGKGGSVFTPLSASMYAPDVVIQPDGKPVITGPGGAGQVVVRYNTDGSLDSSFGTGGVLTTAIGSAGQSEAVVLQPNGDIVVAGYNDINTGNGVKSDFAVARYLGDTPMAVTGFPTQNTVGTPATFTVTDLNASGTTNTGYTGTVHFTSSDPQAVLPPDYTFTPADQGTHTFSATLNTIGTQSLTATDTATSSITGSQTGIKVNPPSLPAATLSVTGFPTTTTAGTAGTITVTAKDANGNVANGYLGTVHFTSSDSQYVLPLDYTFTAADQGVHTFSILLNTAGTQSVTATDTATGSISGSETGIVVRPAAASTFRISAPSSVSRGQAFSVTLTALDPYGNVATGYSGTTAFSSTDRKAVLPPNYIFKASDAGVHTFVNKTTLRTSGKQTISVDDTLTGAAGSVGVNVT